MPKAKFLESINHWIQSIFILYSAEITSTYTSEHLHTEIKKQRTKWVLQSTQGAALARKNFVVGRNPEQVQIQDSPDPPKTSCGEKKEGQGREEVKKRR